MVTNRRDFVKTLGNIAGAGVALSYLPLGEILGNIQNASTSKPNVLFISIDDLNDWVGFLGGHPDVQTPNLDKLARHSVVFSRAYCNSPACNPSRASLMTGITPSTSGVYLNDQPWRKSDVLKNADTIPQHFMKHGYKTMGSGKIFHGSYPDPESWDYYWPSPMKQKPRDPRPENRPLNGMKKTGNFDWGPVDVSKEEMGDWKVADWVIEQINQKHEKPFFLGCGFFRPHLRWYVPPEYFEMYPLDEITLPDVNPADLDDVPEAGKNMAIRKEISDHQSVTYHHQWKQAVQGYLACISFVDECLGRVIEALEKSEHRDNTIIVLWSDHGWHLGEKLHWRKFALWEEATRNILMISAPGVSENGSVCGETVNLTDIYPTLIDLCGLEKLDALEGNSLFQLLKNPSQERNIPAITTWGKNNHAVRTKRWRFIRYADGTEELYDHSTDELEWYNLADEPEHFDVKEDLKKWLPGINANYSPVEKDD